jgi:serine/threonine protein kinase
MATDAQPPSDLDTSFRLHLETILERFEADWLQGKGPALDDFLPAQGRDRAALLPELVLIDLECRWKSGEAVRLEPYLTRYPDLANDSRAILRCLAQEFTLRRRREPGLHLQEYQERFPQYRGLLSLVLPGDLRIDGPSALPPPHFATLSPPGYEILEVLGRGGMGVVYKARWLARDQVVALKMIRDDDPTDPELLKRFRSESELLSRVRHPNIVEIYEAGVHLGRPFLALEYVATGNLREHLARGPLPLPTAISLMATVASAVQYLHDHGIIHRDLKPANILLQRTHHRDTENTEKKENKEGKTETEAAGKKDLDDSSYLPSSLSSSLCSLCLCGEFLFPKITDFGLAKRFGVAAGQTPSGQLLGTPGYLAPEQTTGSRRNIGPAADIWALGAILYELIAGTPPFQGDCVLEVLRRIVDDAPVPLCDFEPTLPKKVENICLRCLEKLPSRRYPSAAALAAELTGCVADASP